MVTINVNYKGEAYPFFDDVIEKVAKKYNGKSRDSGYSFFDNSRDIELTFKSATAAKKFQNHIKRFKCVLEAELVSYEDE